MRMRLLLVCAIATAASAAMLRAEHVRACSIAPFDVAAAAQIADAVVLGDLVDGAGLEAAFEVQRSFGDEPTAARLPFDNRTRHPDSDCSPIFEDVPAHGSGRYLAFLEAGDDGQYHASWFGDAMLAVDGDRLVGPSFEGGLTPTLDWLESTLGGHEVAAPANDTSGGSGARNEIVAAGAVALIVAAGAGAYWLITRSRSGAR